MAIEIQYLAWTVVLGLLQLVLATALATRHRGLAWNAGPRDQPPGPVPAVAGRAERAMRNLLETFPFFAAAALGVVAAERGDAWTALGAQLYFWARVVYVPLYLAGIPYLRSLAWAVSVAGLLMVLAPLLR
ncbi:MAPEG family protein [Pseudoxanthomonas taiwanensis]|jgi:Predicted membrane protein|uniref:MAPEG superfamily protein n=1 Tax=Pseudoxanthomonas taiwanensis TaxID=176598 RepID=A0A921NUD2_9GAMM|nr:MAPEG family protein [Pseudoxanthomonas taiwanensis]KAF1690110.1 hypothetical protein CR938_03320 [Pseudoxanthomonas taiwanensis]MBO2468743.1 hypothetical protein [Xanthomonadaceae bacterium]